MCGSGGRTEGERRVAWAEVVVWGRGESVEGGGPHSYPVQGACS